MRCLISWIKSEEVMKRYLLKTYQFILKFRLSLKIPFKIDVHVVEHCNLNCKGCSHFSTLAAPEFLDTNDYEKSLRHLAKIKKSIGQIQLLGGEPLLHPRLTELIKITKSILPDTQLNIVTNGILLVNSNWLSERENFVEACKINDVLIKISRYPGINYDAVDTNLRKFGIKFKFFGNKGEEYGWAKFPLYVEGFKHISNRLKFLKLTRCGSFNCLQLVGTKIYPCCHAAYVRHLNKYFNLNFEIRKGDYVDLKEVNGERRVRKLLFMSTPFCRYCGLGYKKSVWEKSGNKIEEWIEGSVREL